MDKHSYKGWLNSDSFLKRSFGIFFYYCFASILISSIFFIILLIFVVATGLLGTYLNAFDEIKQIQDSTPAIEKNFDTQNYK